MSARDDTFPPVPRGVFGVCEGCGAVAWELLSGVSTYCMGCDSAAYRQDSEEDYEDWRQRPGGPVPEREGAE